MRIVGLLNTLLGTLLVASGTATLNQWMERVWDGKMRRTASRPLPSGRLTSREALVFGILLSVTGGLYLLVAVNRSVGIAGGFDVAFVFAGVYAAQAEDAAVHPSGGLPRGDAHADRLGGRFSRH